MNKKILTGDEAKKTCNKILKHGNIGKRHDDYGEPYVAGYFEDVITGTGEKVFTCFDNTEKSMFVETFGTIAKAKAWCQGRIEAEGIG